MSDPTLALMAFLGIAAVLGSLILINVLLLAWLRRERPAPPPEPRP